MPGTPSNATFPHQAPAGGGSSHLVATFLSDLDRSLLIALFDPASDLHATAATCGLSLLDVAHWLAQPHIQAQIEAIESLRALRREVWAERLRQEAAEALREAMNSAADPAECRRCANTILRATSPPRRQSLSRRQRGAESSKPGERASAPLEPDAQARVIPDPPATPESSSTTASRHSDDALLIPSPPRPLTPSSSDHLSDTLAQALATLRALGYDTTEAELTDDELDALEDEELDAELDEEIDEYAANLTDAEMAEALALARQYLARPHDTS